MSEDRYPLEGFIRTYAEQHREDTVNGGCTCGFSAWSAEHVAVMAYREAAHRAAIAAERSSER